MRVTVGGFGAAITLFGCAAHAALAGCGGGSTEVPVIDVGATTNAPPSRSAPDWRDAYDLDGDGTHDRIVYEFSGGAHCCYRVGATLSSTGETTLLPFEMDGGFVGGLHLGNPARFTIRTRDGGLPEIVYEIATYNGEPQPLDPAWTKQWGIRSHRVVLCFGGGRAQVRDDSPDLPPCRR